MARLESPTIFPPHIACEACGAGVASSCRPVVFAHGVDDRAVDFLSDDWCDRHADQVSVHGASRRHAMRNLE